MDCPPRYDLPWQMEDQLQCTGTGFVIATEAGPGQGPMIVTNAHVVANAVSIRVRREGNPEKFRAEVITVGHECDLALLRIVDRKRFFGGGGGAALTPLSIDDASVPPPPAGGQVLCCGYPGGDNISVTKGIISRYDMMRFGHEGGDSTAKLLVIQIDAAINSGNR